VKLPPPKRAWGMPGAQCTRSLVCEVVVQHAHEYSQRSHRKSPGIPARNGFNGFLRALPGDRAFLSPSLAKIASRKLDAGVEASGPHDFSVRKQNALVSSAACVHRIQPRVRDDRDTPLVWGGRRGYKSDLRFRKTRIFLQRGWTTQITLIRLRKSDFARKGTGARQRPAAQMQPTGRRDARGGISHTMSAKPRQIKTALSPQFQLSAQSS
jgi:hypothetical protein